jgi:RNA polymerase sigma-70 factor (ECF subfamily)
MLRLLKKQPSHQKVFMERYSSIMTWARSLAKGDEELAEDIVQDAYIQFTLNAPPLDEIQKLDGYLYVLLKNLCLANFRRNRRNRLNQLSIFEYDSAEFAFSRLDFRDQESARDELQKICSFLAIRKNIARTASVFILRFFHGYFPGEIAQILGTSRAAVDVRLLEARKEIKAFLENPKDVKFIGFEDSAKEIFQALPIQTNSQDEFLSELRTVIFKFREGEHLSAQQLQGFYQAERPTPIKVDWLSHLVSCPICLDEVNKFLKLPNLSSRFPTDAIGRDKRKEKNVINGIWGESGE